MNIAFLLAAGKSSRFGRLGQDKLFRLLAGMPVIQHSLQKLQQSALINEIYIAASAENKSAIQRLVKSKKFSKVKGIILGGKTRFGSVKKLAGALTSNGKIFGVGFLRAQKSQLQNKLRFNQNRQIKMPDFFLVHNGANPLITLNEIQDCFAALRDKKISGAGVGRKVSSTIRHVHKGVIPREYIWEMETPQIVRAKDFIFALQKVPGWPHYRAWARQRSPLLGCGNHARRRKSPVHR